MKTYIGTISLKFPDGTSKEKIFIQKFKTFDDFYKAIVKKAKEQGKILTIYIRSDLTIFIDVLF